MVIGIRDGLEIPIYQQIRDQIVMGISDGRLQPGETLPTVRALAAEIGINSMTVNKAYQLLKLEGYIITDRRNGARVAQRFQEREGLSEKNRELLKRLVSEAKLAGVSEEELVQECRTLYREQRR